ncbi:hypothetical protein V2I01_16375 [Micromonospora sp. BRA006-A]|nr:hypothetical protein [Micromonospora sp. BRA006-A]
MTNLATVGGEAAVAGPEAVAGPDSGTGPEAGTGPDSGGPERGEVLPRQDDRAARPAQAAGAPPA